MMLRLDPDHQQTSILHPHPPRDPDYPVRHLVKKTNTDLRQKSHFKSIVAVIEHSILSFPLKAFCSGVLVAFVSGDACLHMGGDGDARKTHRIVGSWAAQCLNRGSQSALAVESVAGDAMMQVKPTHVSASRVKAGTQHRSLQCSVQSVRS
jgi:hypothetical protein